MPIDITIPSPGESITEVVLGPWHKNDGAWVEKDETLVEIESDKVTLEIPAEESGVLQISAAEGDEKQVGDVIGSIDANASRPKASAAEDTASASEEATSAPAAAVEVATATASSSAAATPARATSLARKLAADRGVKLEGVAGTGPSGRITKSDVLAVSPARDGAAIDVSPPVIPASASGRGVRREKLSKLRQRIAERLVAAQRNAAMLTTFNEVDMSAVMSLRSQHKEAFHEKHGVGLGFMSFFVKACVSGLQVYEGINASIDGAGVEYHDYVDVSIAVGTPKGLVVPVLRNAHEMSFAEIEGGIKQLALKARDGKLTMDDMTGGTFTISNGGVYGSMLSTPILNPPQTGILGLHNIVERAVVVDGQVEVRPVMYLALSYD
ncbi:MAG: 2-oxoglutarate dehydrogenase complex dihydrolipoyllysine-residue succinyltransferase, partial [Phycisphaerales bacterium]|nr:2-oxoglutarate dehydrogenase complex dihydrolipoyllysine-residue succinyltransferase [Phycisphaerales bacterium]